MTKILCRVLYTLLVICLLACVQDEYDSVTQKNNLSAKSPQRIISLAPHLTELLFSLDAQERIIATVEYSDYPAAAKNIQRIGDAFKIDWELLALLNPDLVLFWEGGNPQNIFDELQRKKIPTLALKNPRLNELPELLEQLALKLGVDRSELLISNYLTGLAQLKNKYSHKKSIKVFYQISPDPIYTVNGEHVISEMLNVCGAINVFDDINIIAAPVSAEAVLAVKPDVILTTHTMHAAVVESWSATTLINAKNILSVSSDEVSRASLRMLKGTKNICEVLDHWRGKTNHYE